MLISFYMRLRDYYTHENQREYNSVDQAGGHRGITAGWSGVILATYAHINPYNVYMAEWVGVCNQR